MLSWNCILARVIRAVQLFEKLVFGLRKFGYLMSTRGRTGRLRRVEQPFALKTGLELLVCKLNGPGANLNQDYKTEIPDKHRSGLSSEVEEKFGKWTRTI